MTRLRLPRAARSLRSWPAVPDVLFTIVAVEVGLRTRPLHRLADDLGVPLQTQVAGPPVGRTVALDRRDARRVLTALRVLHRWPFGDTCLRQALVTGRLLRHLGPRLCVGVAKRSGEVRAHAWVEIGDACLDPLASAAGYSLLVRPAGDRR